MDRSKKYLVSGITTIVLAAGIFSFTTFNTSEQVKSFSVKDVEENTSAAIMPSYVKYLVQSGLIGWENVEFSEEDLDFDGLNNLQEFLYGTDTRDANSDDDELSDADEVLVYGSSPVTWDSDGDKISDHEEKAAEIWTFNLLKFESTDMTDSDLDGILNVQEKLFKTDPRNEDSDSDGLNDGEEILVYDTNPLEKSMHHFFRIANFKSGQSSSIGEQFVMGSAKPGSEVEIYLINDKMENILIAQTVADELGKFAVWTSAIEQGNYLMTGLFKEDDEVLGFSYPLKVKFTESNLVEAPLLKEISTINTNKVPVFDIQSISANTSIVAFWHGINFMNLIVTAAANQEISFKPEFALQPGENEVTLYALSNENNSMSKAQRLSFTINSPITGVRYKESKSALFWAGVLIGFALYGTRRQALRTSSFRATYSMRRAGI